jgi:hypothetical protein
MKLSAVVLGVALVGLGACSQQAGYKWYKAGVTSDDFNKDAFECESKTRAGYASFGGGLVGSAAGQDFFDRCLVSKGYQKGPA